MDLLFEMNMENTQVIMCWGNILFLIRNFNLLVKIERWQIIEDQKLKKGKAPGNLLYKLANKLTIHFALTQQCPSQESL